MVTVDWNIIYSNQWFVKFNLRRIKNEKFKML